MRRAAARPWAEAPSLVQAYGVTYTPDSRWTLTRGIEQGLIFGDSFIDGTSDVERTALSARATFGRKNALRTTLGAEFRNDDEKNGPDDTRSYLLTGGVRVAVSDDWRFIAQADVALTDASSTAKDGDYADASVGICLPPNRHDRLKRAVPLHLSLRFAGADQVTFDGARTVLSRKAISSRLTELRTRPTADHWSQIRPSPQPHP